MHPDIKMLYPYNRKVVAYALIYAEICDGVKAGLLLSQLLYWWERMNGTEFFKKSQQLQYECRMSSQDVRRTIITLKGLGFINVRIKGLPPRYHFRLNAIKIFEKIREHHVNDGKYTNELEEESQINLVKMDKSIMSKDTNQLCQNEQIDSAKMDESIMSKDTNPIYNTRLLHNTTQDTTTLESNVRSVERTESLPLKVKEVIDFFNQKCKKQLKGSKTLVKDIRIVLDEFTMEQVKAVIDNIRNSKWHIEHGQVKLSAIMRPTKFHEKLEDIDTPRGIKVFEHPIRQMAGANNSTAPEEDVFAVLHRQKEQGILNVEIPKTPMERLSPELQQKYIDRANKKKEESKNE